MTLRRKILVLTLVLVISMIISACSDSSLNASRGKDQNTGRANSGTVAGDLLAFEGRVFVASTKPENNLWQSAGWQISTQPVAGDGKSVPADCTLYPHQGVDDQWIGSCTGYTYIPRDGAHHIAVMHTQPDGTTRMIQVAPPPLANEP